MNEGALGGRSRPKRARSLIEDDNMIIFIWSMAVFEDALLFRTLLWNQNSMI